MPKSAQKCPKDGQDRPKFFPNGAQDPPKSSFQCIFWAFFSISKFASIFSSIFDRFSIRELSLQPLILLISSRENAIFYKIAIFDHNTQNHRKTLPKSFQNPPKIHPKSMKNRKKSLKKATMTQEA